MAIKCISKWCNLQFSEINRPIHLYDKHLINLDWFPCAPTFRIAHSGSNEAYDVAFITILFFFSSLDIYSCRKQRKLLCTYQSDENKISVPIYEAWLINSSKYEIITDLLVLPSNQNKRLSVLLLFIYVCARKLYRNDAAEPPITGRQRTEKRAIQIKSNNILNK